jgi:hypothetical protein
LVGFDRVRWAAAAPRLAWTGGAAAGFFALLWAATSLQTVVLVQFVWNLWHVAAQHVGVARIYAIRGSPERRSSGQVDKGLLMTLAFYAFWRLWTEGAAGAGWPVALGGGAVMAAGGQFLDAPVALTLIGSLAWREWRDYVPRRLPRVLYLSSLCIHYGAMIAFCRAGMTDWAIATATVNGLFHAIEYFGIVTWSVLPRADRPGQFSAPLFFRHWAASLGIFAASIATLGLVLSSGHFGVWVALNALVAYLHYAYDGVIWKMPDVFPASRSRLALTEGALKG